MIELVLVFCLSADGARCVENRPVLDAVLSPMGCMVAAQPMAADFLQSHPAYRLRSWRCEIDRPKQKLA